MSREESKLDAAEYVIGTLSAVERKAFEVSIENDNETREDVKFWERAFGALNASISPEPVPAHMWDRIERALPAVDAAYKSSAMDGAEPMSSETVVQEGVQETVSVTPTAERTSAVAGTAAGAKVGAQTKAVPTPANDNALDKLRKSMRRWRFGAIAASIAAICLGAYVANDRLNLVPIPGQQPAQQQLANALDGKEFVAVVNANGDQPSLIVNVNAETGEVTVRSVGVERPDGKSLELWYVPEGQKAVSVGLVGEGEIDLREITAKGGDLLAISLEPQGGSPTGTATGPVIYTGKLVDSGK